MKTKSGKKTFRRGMRELGKMTAGKFRRKFHCGIYYVNLLK